MKKKRIKKIVILIICAVLLIAITCLSVYSCTLHIKQDLSLWQNRDYSQFDMDELYSEFLPEYSEYKKSTNQAHFYYHDGSMNLGLSNEMVCLELSFDDNTYSVQKEKVYREYPFVSEDIWDNNELLTVASADVGNYYLYVYDLCVSGFATDYIWAYPSIVPFVAFNDNQKVIRWGVIFYGSLDYFENKQNFIEYIKTNEPIGW